MFYKSTKRSFTLLEMMIAIAIITLLGGLVAHRGLSAYRYYQVTSSVTMLKSYLTQAKHLALIHEVDVTVKIAKMPSGVIASIQLGHLAPKQAFNLPSLRLKGFKLLSESHKMVFDRHQFNPVSQELMLLSPTDQKVKVKVTKAHYHPTLIDVKMS